MPGAQISLESKNTVGIFSPLKIDEKKNEMVSWRKIIENVINVLDLLADDNFSGEKLFLHIKWYGRCNGKYFTEHKGIQ